MPTANKPTDVFRSIDMSGGRDACWPFKGALNAKGRPYFTVRGKKYLAYRLAKVLVDGEDSLPDDELARHTCDNEVCCNPSHIIRGGHQDNMNDMKERERHGLPHHTVRAIRKLASTTNGPTHAEIGELYGIGRSTVTEIVTRKNYDHVKDEDDGTNDSNQG
jgi:hypothetical protein